MSEKIAREFYDRSLEAFEQEHRRVNHNLAQLDDEQLWKRPEAHVNSVGNIIVHLCGNMRQWFLHGMAGEKDVRNRPMEFVAAEGMTKAQLQRDFNDLMERIEKLMETLDPGMLLKEVRITEFGTSGLGAIYRTINHLEGHSLQIAYITHMLTGERYVPFWKPADERK
jgi:hypothetical protein